MQPVLSSNNRSKGCKGGKGGKGGKIGKGDGGGDKGGTPPPVMHDRKGNGKGGVFLSAREVMSISALLDESEDATLSLYATGSPFIAIHIEDEDRDVGNHARDEREEMINLLGRVLTRTNLIRSNLGLPQR